MNVRETQNSSPHSCSLAKMEECGGKQRTGTEPQEIEEKPMPDTKGAALDSELRSELFFGKTRRLSLLPTGDRRGQAFLLLSLI